MNQQKTKKIAFYIGSLSRGGAERVIVNLAAYFNSQGYQVTLVTKLKEEEEYPVPEGVTRILADLTEKELSSSRIRNLYGRIKKLRNIWKNVQPDGIVSFIKKNNFMALVSAKGLSIPVIVSVRSNPSREYPDLLNKMMVQLLFPMAKGIVLQTKEATEFFSKKIQKKSIILSNPVSTAFLQEPFQGVRKKEIVWVGRMDQNKNPNMLLRAFLTLAERYPDWNLKFIGTGTEQFSMEQLCQELQMGKRVVFLGSQKDVATAIRESSIFVLTSKQEGLPNALMEAMVSGLAVIATDCPCGGPRELIVDHENGLLIPVDNEKRLTESLEYLFNHEEERMEMGKQAEKLIEKVHPDVVNRQWKEYIERRIYN